ncbi:Laminin B (Domain IV) [Posidoniimonas polymericola]|uniref:Laminin B (Domain IV) n=1 Tax=Posidoniimonas polymericola TaxID=2528002 RepID=A0A5C5ZFD0_9BACT|nr:laminin B domain-containing protein [Posidoniimonas polymericola]TWT85263.1 Laminin B (Domain IV) [Posidoniimonas polymericola]
MKAVAALLFSLAALTSAGAHAASSTFDVDDEGWTIIGDAQSGTGSPDYLAAGGNPGGHIAAADNVLGGTWYFQAPAKFHGDFSFAYGADLTFDLMQSSISSQFDDEDVILRGGGLFLTYDTSMNPGVAWTSYSVPLEETAGWTVGGSSPAAAPTAAEMMQVLSDLTDLQIRGEYRSGSDTGSLDNVALIPAPGGLSLAAAGLALAVRGGRRRGAQLARAPATRQEPSPTGAAVSQRTAN